MKKIGKIFLLILATLGVLGIIIGTLLFYFITRIDNKYTGQQLFDAVNNLRTSKSLTKIELDPSLCNNLVERWIGVRKQDNGHKGLETWLKKENILGNPKYEKIGELYVTATTPQNAIAFWESSPGHRTTLEMQEMKYGCAYANDGTGVVILAAPRR